MGVEDPGKLAGSLRACVGRRAGEHQPTSPMDESY